MRRAVTFAPDWTSPPGDTITDILDQRHMSPGDLAQRIGMTSDFVDSLIRGGTPITIALARRLEEVLGSTRGFWMSRDFHYRETLARIGQADEWLRQMPVSDLVRLGWLNQAFHRADQVAECLRFFGVSSVPAWQEKYDTVLETVRFRTSPTFASSPTAAVAWLRRGEIEGQRIRCGPWNPSAFRRSLEKVKELTRVKRPDVFLPRLQSISAAHGVAVAVVRAPTGCRASGATRFLSEDRALLLLSFRHRTDDHFWFSFFHEAGHLLLHGTENWELEDPDPGQGDREAEANHFAEAILIPSELRPHLLALRASTRDVIRFARRAGVSPGLVVGQLQHHRRIAHSQLNGLKRRFSWDDISLGTA